MIDPKHCIEICNRLLRGERSAVETYDQVIAKYPDESGARERLRIIRNEHARSVSALEENVRSMGGSSDVTSGPWGAVAEVTQAAANVFGLGAALSSLETGEKAGRNDYEQALDDDCVMAECKELIRDHLLPPIASHLAQLHTLAHAEG